MLASLLGALLSGEAVATAKRLKTQMFVMAIVGVIALVGVIFLLLAGYLYAAERLGAIPAALWFGGGFLGAALLGLIVYKVSAGARARREANRRKAELSTMAAATALALLPALASRKAGLGLVVAPFLAAVGYQILKENTRRPDSEKPED
jgi:hypothetical protein